MIPAAFFLVVNFAASGVKILFFSRLLYFLFLISLFLILRRFNLDRILKAAVGGSAIIIFLYGIVQKFVLFPIYLKQVNPGDNFYSQALVARIKTGRIFSIFSLPTLYAIICAVLTLFIFHYLLTSPKDKKSKFFWTFLLLAGLFNLALTQSFGGILYLSVGIFIYLLLSGILDFKYLAPAAMVLSLFLFITIALRFSEAKELEPITLRFSNWQQSARMIEASPFWGSGLGNYETEISYYTMPGEAKSIYAHNFFLQFIAETGIIITCIIGLFLVISRKKLKPHRYKDKVLYISVFLMAVFYSTIDIGIYFFAAGITAVVALSQVYIYPGQNKKVKPGLWAIFGLLAILLLVEAVSDNYRKKGDFLRSQRDYAAAEIEYKKSLTVNPYNFKSQVGRAHVNLFSAVNDKNMQLNAEKYLDKALNIYPGSAYGNYLKSKIEFKKSHLFRSFYYAAKAYNKNKRNDHYKQWYRLLKNTLETGLLKKK